jgi:hypothetical protein
VYQLYSPSYRSDRYGILLHWYLSYVSLIGVIVSFSVGVSF